MTIEKRLFGYTKDAEQVDCYTLSDCGMIVEVLTYGGTIRSIIVPAADGARDVALGFDSVGDYETRTCYIGALIGRVANRIGNARFSINGKTFFVEKNEGANCLHGGYNGFDRRVWAARTDARALILTLHSPDSDGGFPAELETEVCYSLKDRALTIGYTAVCGADTPVSLSNHCYFNLGGHDSGDVETHSIRIFADAITPVDGALIPTGELLEVSGTPFDLRERSLIGPGLTCTHPQIAIAGGYDHNFALTSSPYRPLSLAAVVEYGDLSMSCMTTQPGIQFYSGNFLSGESGKTGAVYKKRSGLCLEPQGWPDAVNKKAFPDCVLRKGDVYSHLTVYSFR